MAFITKTQQNLIIQFICRNVELQKKKNTERKKENIENKTTKGETMKYNK